MIDYDAEDEDPVVAEVRRVRAEIAARFDYDLAALCRDAQQRTDAAALAGRTVIAPPPRHPPADRPSEQRAAG